MKTADPLLVKFVRGHADPVTNVAVMGGGMLSASGSKVGIVPMQQDRGVVQVNPAKLLNTKPDRITCLLAMPLHRWFVVGSEGMSSLPLLISFAVFVSTAFAWVQRLTLGTEGVVKVVV